jgi:hypothetical protein
VCHFFTVFSLRGSYGGPRSAEVSTDLGRTLPEGGDRPASSRAPVPGQIASHSLGYFNITISGIRAFSRLLAIGVLMLTSLKGLADASQYAVSTLVFVSPELALPRIIGQLRTDLDPVAANALTDFEFGVWSTPAGTTFVDGESLSITEYRQVLINRQIVLASQRNNTQSTKGKDQELVKWEAELRKSLASKKASAPSTLTKQEQSLVQAQLDKEARIREDVTAIKAKLERGLRFVHSIVDANVPEFKVYMSSVVSLLLKSALSRTGCALLGRTGFHTYLVRK